MATLTHWPENIRAADLRAIAAVGPTPRSSGGRAGRAKERSGQKKFPLTTAASCLQRAFNISVRCHIGAPGIATIAAIH
jgi:hypothetical protein